MKVWKYWEELFPIPEDIKQCDASWDGQDVTILTPNDIPKHDLDDHLNEIDRVYSDTPNYYRTTARSDVMRVWAMREYGGLYVDRDIRLSGDLERLGLHRHPIAAFQCWSKPKHQDAAQNAMMWAREPGHPIWDAYLDQMLVRLQRAKYGAGVWSTTGAGFGKIATAHGAHFVRFPLVAFTTREQRMLKQQPVLICTMCWKGTVPIHDRPRHIRPPGVQ